MTVKQLIESLQKALENGVTHEDERVYFGDDLESADYFMRRTDDNGKTFKFSLQKEWF
jgi:hypothetical protein